MKYYNKLSVIRHSFTLLFFFSSVNIMAQDQSMVGQLTEKEQSIDVYFGMDYSFSTVGVAYKRGFTFLNRPLTIGTDLAFPLITPDLKDYRIKIIKSQLSVYRTKYFDFAVTYSPTLAGTGTKAQRILAFGNEFGLLSGYWGPKWGFGLEVTADMKNATRIEHTSYYREVVYEDIKDGWYKNTGGNIRYNVVVSRRFKRLDGSVRIGNSNTLKFKKYMFIPLYYFVIGSTYRF